MGLSVTCRNVLKIFLETEFKEFMPLVGECYNIRHAIYGGGVILLSG